MKSRCITGHFRERSCSGRSQLEQRRCAVVEVFCEPQETGRDEVIRDPLYCLTRDSEPARRLGDGMRITRRHTEELPARLCLPLAPGDRLTNPPKVPCRLEHVRDEERNFVLDHIDIILSL